jgi:hypothetical protein
MNRVGELLRENPEIVGALIEASPDKLAVPSWVLREFAPSLPGGESLIELMDVDPEFAESFGDAHLGIISAGGWDAAIRNAKPSVTEEPREWVSMVAAPNLEFGVTLPEDAHATHRWSLFATRAGITRPLTIETSASGSLRWALTDVRHCGFPERSPSDPDRLRCAPGRCGSCRLIRTRAKPPGLICLCEHEAP